MCVALFTARFVDIWGRELGFRAGCLKSGLPFSFIQFYLHRAFNNGHCPKVALQECVSSVSILIGHRGLRLGYSRGLVSCG